MIVINFCIFVTCYVHIIIRFCNYVVFCASKDSLSKYKNTVLVFRDRATTPQSEPISNTDFIRVPDDNGASEHARITQNLRRIFKHC